MLLQRLRQYAETRMQLPPMLYAYTPIAAVVELGADGKPLSPRPTTTTDPSTPRGRRGTVRLAPEVVRASGIKPLLLADNGEYTFGIARDPAKQQRAAASHVAYVELVNRCAAESEEPAAIAVKAFYENGGLSLLTLGDDWDFGLKVTFRVHLPGSAVFPIDLPKVQAFWASVKAAEDDPILLPCIVCGEVRPALESLPGKVKGIRGGQTAGTSIISANAEAFESYGLERSHIAPTCVDCAEKFTVALNHLLSSASTRLHLGGATFTYWTREPESEFSLNIISNPTTGDVSTLLRSVHSGRRPAEFDDAAFFAATLSGSGGRAVVRDWIDTRVGNVKQSVARWFQLQEIVDPYGQPHEPIGLFALAASTVRNIEDLPDTVPRSLLRAALTGAPLPKDLAFHVVRRNRAEQDITRTRAALLKSVLLSARPETFPEGYMVALETENPEPAYHLGRLLAVLEEIQRAALPGVSATIIDRFFGTASAAPAGVFARLVRGAQPHLSRLERDRPGAFFALQRRMEEVMGHLAGFPRTLSLEQQGLFSLGYYHQRAHDRAEAMSHGPAGGHAEATANSQPGVNE